MDRVRLWGLMTALGVVGMCLWQLQRGPSASVVETATELGWGALAAAAAAAVVVAAVEVVRRRASVRRARQAKVLEQLHAAVGRTLEEGGHTVQVARWSGAAPAKIRVTLPRGLPMDKLGTAICQEVGRAVSSEGGPRRWQARRLPLRPTLVLVPRSASPVEDQREAVADRVVALLKKTIPGAKSVRIKEWTECDEPSVIVATYEPSPRLSSASVESAILRVVGDNFPGRWRANWERESDRVTFELKPGLPDLIDRPLGLGLPAELELRYGVTADGEVQSWRPGGSSTAPHCLVIGPTGGGKTFALRAMALDAISQGMVVNGCDPKMIELVGLIGVPGVGEIATKPWQIADLVESMYDLMMKRYEDLETLRVRKEDLQPILFIIDEFFILRMRLQRAHKLDDGKGEHPALGMVSEMLALARSARIHLVIGIQRPDAEFLTGAARDNLRHRLSLSQLSPKGAEMMWGDMITGTDLPAIPGRAVATRATGAPTEIQVYRVPDPDPRLRQERTPEELAILEEVFATAASTGSNGGELVEIAASTPEPVVDQVPVEGDIPSVQSGVPAEPAREFVDVLAEAVVPGDSVELDGAWVQVLEAEPDAADEDYVELTWADGSVSLPADDVIRRWQQPPAA